MIKDEEFLKLEKQALELSEEMEKIEDILKEKYPLEEDEAWVLYPNGFSKVTLVSIYD